MMITSLAYDRVNRPSIESESEDSFWPHGLQPNRFLRPRDFPGKGTGVGCHFLLSTECWQIQSSFNCITESVWSWNTTKHISICQVTIILSWNYELHFSSGSVLWSFSQLYIRKYCTTSLKNAIDIDVSCFLNNSFIPTNDWKSHQCFSTLSSFSLPVFYYSLIWTDCLLSAASFSSGITASMISLNLRPGPILSFSVTCLSF